MLTVMRRYFSTKRLLTQRHAERLHPFVIPFTVEIGVVAGWATEGPVTGTLSTDDLFHKVVPTLVKEALLQSYYLSSSPKILKGKGFLYCSA